MRHEFDLSHQLYSDLNLCEIIAEKGGIGAHHWANCQDLSLLPGQNQ